MELFTTGEVISTTEEVIFLRNELYKMKITHEGIAPYFMKISEMRDQLQELGQVMFDIKMINVVPDALPREWGKLHI